MINNVVLMGRLVADPELRTTPSGRTLVNFRIAVDRSFVRQGEERQADFIPCTAWEQTANFISRYFHKGSMIAVIGSLQSRTYDDKATGQKRTAYDVVVREASFTGSKAESGTGSYAAPAAPAAPVQPAPAFQSAGAADFEEITDDEDLPF